MWGRARATSPRGERPLKRSPAQTWPRRSAAAESWRWGPPQPRGAPRACAGRALRACTHKLRESSLVRGTRVIWARARTGGAGKASRSPSARAAPHALARSRAFRELLSSPEPTLTCRGGPEGARPHRPAEERAGPSDSDLAIAPCRARRALPPAAEAPWPRSAHWLVGRSSGSARAPRGHWLPSEHHCAARDLTALLLRPAARKPHGAGGAPRRSSATGRQGRLHGRTQGHG